MSGNFPVSFRNHREDFRAAAAGLVHEHGLALSCESGAVEVENLLDVSRLFVPAEKMG